MVDPCLRRFSVLRYSIDRKNVVEEIVEAHAVCADAGRCLRFTTNCRTTKLIASDEWQECTEVDPNG